MAQDGGPVSLGAIQGNVICGYGTGHARFVFARVRDPHRARRWLTRRLASLTWNASWQAEPPPHTINLGFSYSGLLELGVPRERFGGLEAFTAGMSARAEQLGDRGASAPEAWQLGMRDNHLVVILTAWSADAVERLLADAGEELAGLGSGLALSHVQTAAALPGEREHFGFGDGFSQPAIAGASTGPRRGEGTLGRFGRWRDLALGEFILGHPDEGGEPAPAPTGPLAVDATFMVIRKLEQDVAAFRRYTATQADALGRDPEWLAAKLIGRWPNGSAVAKHPERPGPAAAEDREHVNDFRYADDPNGHACPLGAHVRRANPRDALGWDGRLTQRHRLLRRGISYGPPLAAGYDHDDGRERGLMFVCFQSSLERQFEFVQRQWLGDGNVFGLGGDRDPLLAGDGNGQIVIQGRPPRFLSGLPPLVRMRGGDYFLYPGRTGLEALASGRC